MSNMKLTSVIITIALATTAAQAAPKKLQPQANVDHIQTVCKTIVKDSNGKVIGQRVTSDGADGVVASASYATAKRSAAAFGDLLEPEYPVYPFISTDYEK